MAMAVKTKVSKIIAVLHELYPNPTCALFHHNAFELLVATILSAQANDKTINTVTPELFAKFPTPAAMAAAPLAEIEHLVSRVNFFHNKSKNISAMSKALVEKYHGEVPQSIEALIKLPGVARKTANVVLGTVWDIKSGIVVDTHVMRLSQLLGLSTASEAPKIERDLMAIVPQDDWILFSNLLIYHGRQICIARRPLCKNCGLNKLCPSAFRAVPF
ncbi:MAG: endonuclease III [Deltaproteobacteria bacterium]|nr:endonuclease III [Deltaproteobacteria bacterium]